MFGVLASNMKYQREPYLQQRYSRGTKCGTNGPRNICGSPERKSEKKGKKKKEEEQKSEKNKRGGKRGENTRKNHSFHLNFVDLFLYAHRYIIYEIF